MPATRRKTPKRSTSASRPDQPIDDVELYARQVVAGEIVAGPDVRAACRRHLRDLNEGPARGVVYRPEKAAHAIGFVETVCRHKDGRPFLLQLWQKFIVGCLFGWYGVDGFRRFRTAFIEIAKGNGKSPLAAAIGLYMLVADGEPHAEIYAAGKNRDQAMVAFRSAVVMRDSSPALAKRLQKTPNNEKCSHLAYVERGGWFKAISRETAQSGPRVHCGIVDEIHEHPNRELLDILRTGAGKCRRSLIFEITNSGVDRTSICYEHHEYSQQVAGGMVDDDSWFAFVCGLDEGEDPLEDEGCWIKANPNLGVSIHEKELRTAVREAKGMPSAASKIRRLYFCQWVDAADPWISATAWLPCEEEPDGDPFELWRGRECVGGIDLSGTTDLTALGLVFPRDDEGYDVLVEFWTPEDTVFDRTRSDRVPYDRWVREGCVHATPGRAVDYSFVAQRISELQSIFNFKRLAFDPYRIKYLEKELADIGVEMQLLAHGQGFYRSQDSGLWMPWSIQVAEKLIFEQKLHVVPNACLRWNVASAVMEKDAKDNRAFTKRKATGRIDGAVAVVMAIGAASETEPADTGGPTITILN